MLRPSCRCGIDDTWTEQRTRETGGCAAIMTTIVYGECIGPRDSTSVRISSLACQGCELETDHGAALNEGEVSLWIGAIGPFSATATCRDANHLSLRFQAPLDPAILRHFHS